MTENKIPDVIWASSRPQDVGDRWTGPHKCYDDQTKYLRAEPVKALLKQARDALAFQSSKGNLTIQVSMINVGNTIEKIDKFLEGK